MKYKYLYNHKIKKNNDYLTSKYIYLPSGDRYLENLISSFNVITTK